MFLRDFVLGNNETGLVENMDDKTIVIGGVNSALSGDFLFGGPDVYYGSYSIQSTFSYPTATVNAWNEYVQSLTSSHGVVPTSSTLESGDLTQYQL